MSVQLRRLIEEQNTLWQRMQDIQAAAESETRDLTAEERQNWDQAEERLTVVSGDIERLNRMAQLQQIDRSQIVSTTGEPGDRRGTDTEDQARRYNEAFGLYLRGGMDRLTPDQRNLMMDHEVDLRAMGAGIDTAAWVHRPGRVPQHHDRDDEGLRWPARSRRRHPDVDRCGPEVADQRRHRQRGRAPRREPAAWASRTSAWAAGR